MFAFVYRFQVFRGMPGRSMTTIPKIYRCPSCRAVIDKEPPTICPECNVGIPVEKGHRGFERRNPRAGFTGNEVIDRSGMPLDEYVRRMKRSGYE